MERKNISSDHFPLLSVKAQAKDLLELSHFRSYKKNRSNVYAFMFMEI